MFFGALILKYLHIWLLTGLLTWFGLQFIDPETCPQVGYQIFYGPYPNRTYGFASPSGLWNIVARVTLWYSYLFTLIDLFYWSKISFKFFVQALFCWLLTFVYHIYWIRAHSSWTFYLGVFENYQWEVSKLDIWIWFPRRFMCRTMSSRYIIWLIPQHWLHARVKQCWTSFSKIYHGLCGWYVLSVFNSIS